MGVAVTFIAILELLRESVIEVVQSSEFAPLHVRAASAVRLVSDDVQGIDAQNDEII
jgi:segregation and condensation protein A